ncbi:MAG: CsgG/HfaB family protein [Treponema sp.]|jgi:curli biogenesis system outer membrane secretion channel CsgG|nr:CsgG/HfaB family protein [Treponema sp.]
MKNKFLWVMFTVAAATFIVSCATSIPISVRHPPRMDTNGIERLALIPFSGPGYQQQIAAELTATFREKISEMGVFKIVEAVVYQPSAADAIFTGEVTNYTVQDGSHQVDRKTKDGKIIQITIYDRKVSLGFTYRLIRGRDGVVIGSRNITVEASDSAQESAGALKLGVSMAMDAARARLGDFNRELAPWTSMEKLTLDKETSKDKVLKKRMKDAAALVKAGQYKAAQEAYATIYAETGSVAAGYNRALLAQPLDGLEAAISLMSGLYGATGYAKASVELARLRGFLNENARAAANKTGVSQQTIAIQRAAEGLAAIFPAGSRVSLLNISKSEKDMVDVIIRDITAFLMNKDITVLERENLNLIKAEQQYQTSGEVSDESYVGIGHMLGVETIVIFSITGSGYQRKLTVRCVSVETGKVLYNESTEI